MGECTYHLPVVNLTALDFFELAAGRDCFRLAIGNLPDCDRPLGDQVGKISPGVDQFIRVHVQRPKHRPDDGPV